MSERKSLPFVSSRWMCLISLMTPWPLDSFAHNCRAPELILFCEMCSSNNILLHLIRSCAVHCSLFSRSFSRSVSLWRISWLRFMLPGFLSEVEWDPAIGRLYWDEVGMYWWNQNMHSSELFLYLTTLKILCGSAALWLWLSFAKWGNMT